MFMNFFRGIKESKPKLKPSNFWKRNLIDVYTRPMKRDRTYRLKIRSNIHKGSAVKTAIWFLLEHTNAYLVTDKTRVKDITEEYPILLGRVFDEHEFKNSFMTNRYYNEHSPSERSDSGRFNNDMFIFIDYSHNDSILNRCGINRVLQIETR